MLKTTAQAAAELDALVAERVELALSDPATQAALAARGISLDEARERLTAKVNRDLDRKL